MQKCQSPDENLHHTESDCGGGIMLRCHHHILIFFGRDRLAHSVGSAGSSNNHEHGRIVSVSELLLTVTPYTSGLAIGFTFLFWKRK